MEQLCSDSGWFLYIKKFLPNKRDSAMIGREKIKDIIIFEKKGRYNEKKVDER